MEQLVEEGLVQRIGITNVSVKKTQDLLKYAKIKPAVNQVELHPYFRNQQLHDFCDKEVGFNSCQTLVSYFLHLECGHELWPSCCMAYLHC